MWYFAWILGVGFAASFGIINAMWLESVCDIDHHGIDESCSNILKNSNNTSTDEDVS